nr:hypothetical protein BHM03_00054885 [Ipomoea trifida]
MGHRRLRTRGCHLRRQLCLQRQLEVSGMNSRLCFGGGSPVSMIVSERRRRPQNDGKGIRCRKLDVLHDLHLQGAQAGPPPTLGTLVRPCMEIINNFINDIFEKLAQEASRIARYNKKPTITSREIQTTVKLVLPVELAKHAIIEGTKVAI